MHLAVTAGCFELKSFVRLVSLIPDAWDLLGGVVGTGKMRGWFLQLFLGLGTLPLALWVYLLAV